MLVCFTQKHSGIISKRFTITGVVVDLQSILGTQGVKLEYTLYKMLDQHKKHQTHVHSLIQESFEVTNSPKSKFLDKT